MHKSKILNPKAGVFVFASASAVAAAWYEREHRTVSRIDLDEQHLRIERLASLRHDRQLMQTIDAELRREWGPFAFLGLASADELAREAGDNVFIVGRPENGRLTPIGCLQTITANLGGDPQALLDTYPTFEALTSRDSWRHLRGKVGDTIVLLQITIFRTDARGGGVGSLLRNALLNILPDGIEYALTTTPIDVPAGATAVDITDSKTFTPAMKFHLRGGAVPSELLLDYKLAPVGSESSHGSSIVVMRYQRDSTGAWQPAKPAMRLHKEGPIEEQAIRAVHRLESIWSVRPKLRGAAKRLTDLRRLHVPIALRPKRSWRHPLRGSQTAQS